MRFYPIRGQYFVIRLGDIRTLNVQYKLFTNKQEDAESEIEVESMHAEIERLLDRMEEAYARRDAEALAAFYHPNTRYPLPTGGVAVGPAAIRKHLPELFAMIPEDIETETISREIDLVTPAVAVIDLRVQNYRRTAEGREPVSVEGFTMVAVREEGRWLLAALRGALVR